MEEKALKKKRFTLKDIIYISIIFLLTAGMVVMAVFLFTKKSKEEQRSYYDNKVAAFAVENANYSKGQIVFIGDSITDLCHLDNYYQDLPKKTYNRGIGGDVTDGVYRRLQVSLYDIEPSEIVLMIGINDINLGKSTDEIVTNYKNILDDIKIHLPTAKLFAMSILPMNEDLGYFSDIDAQNQKVIAANARIKPLVEEKEYTYVDLFSSVKNENGRLTKEYSIDGIHLSDAGFKVWANMVKPLL